MRVPRSRSQVQTNPLAFRARHALLEHMATEEKRNEEVEIPTRQRTKLATTLERIVAVSTGAYFLTLILVPASILFHTSSYFFYAWLIFSPIWAVFQVVIVSVLGFALYYERKNKIVTLPLRTHFRYVIRGYIPVIILALVFLGMMPHSEAYAPILVLPMVVLAVIFLWPRHRS
jgi:uncharacterized membrane protein YdbT with pleckstrin-like domain